MFCNTLSGAIKSKLGPIVNISYGVKSEWYKARLEEKKKAEGKK